MGRPQNPGTPRDVAVKGPAFLSGKQAGGAATAAFGSSLYGNREQRMKLDFIGEKPKGIKDADLQKYSFHWTFVFPHGRLLCDHRTGGAPRSRSSI